MSDHRPSDPAKLQRQKRLEASLRENLKRRKIQTRARDERDLPQDEEGGRDAVRPPSGDGPES